MYCPNCGKKASGNFCANCGAPLEQQLASGLQSAEVARPVSKGGTISGVIVVLVILAVIGTVAFSFISGKIRYYETYSTPGESRGYFGRKAEVLDSKEALNKAFDQLTQRTEFEGKDLKFYLLSLSNERINATIQNPDVKKNFDEYYYDGTKVFHPDWDNRGPYKIGDTAQIPLVSLSDIQPEGIYQFNQQVKQFIDENNVEMSEDYDILIQVRYDFDGQLKLHCGISGTRENYTFESDPDGQHFQLIEKT